MNTLARITGVILIALGLLVIAAAPTLAVLGGVRDVLRLAGSLPVAPRAGLIGLLVLAVALGHGFLLAGVGEALWLLSSGASGPIAVRA